MKSIFIKNFMITGFGNFLVILFGLLNSIIITRWLGEEGKGVYTVVVNVVIFVNLLFGEGLRRSNTIIIAQNKYYLKKILFNNLMFLIIIGVISSLFLMFNDFLINVIKNLNFKLLTIALLISLFSIMWQATQAIFLGLKMISQYTLLMVGTSFIILFINGVGVSFFNFDLYEILSSMIFANFFVYIIGLAYLYKIAGSQLKIQNYKAGNQFYLTIKSTLTNIDIYIFRRSGIFFLNNFKGASAVGVFSVAFLFSDLIQRLPNLAGTLVFSKVANNDISIHEQTAKIVRTLIFILMLVMILLIIFGKILILFLYGTRFVGAYLPLVTMSIGLILVGAGSVIHSYYMGKKFPAKMIILNSILSLVAIILNYFLINRYSILGAGIGYSLVLSIWGISYIIMFANETKIKIQNLVLIKKSDLNEIIIHLKNSFVHKFKKKFDDK